MYKTQTTILTNLRTKYKQDILNPRDVTTHVMDNLSPEARRRRSRTEKLIGKNLGKADVT